MQNLIAALGALFLSAVGLIPLDMLPAGLARWRDAGLIVLTLYLTWQAIVRWRVRSKPLVPSEPPQPPAEPATARRPDPEQTGEALILLSLLQDKGRFLDYLSEDIAAYNDAQVAAASRVVHQGCSAVIKEYFAIAPTHAGAEGGQITIEKSSDPNRFRLVGKLTREPPYNGVVVHRGWKTTRVSLPRFTRPIDPSGENIITPVEVEVR